MNNTINGRTPEEIKKGLECCGMAWKPVDCEGCLYTGRLRCGNEMHDDALAYIQQLERERDAAVRTARWQFERRGKDGVTELPVCSGCGATPKYYAPKNDVGMQVPPYCHECGAKMDAEVEG